MSLEKVKKRGRAYQCLASYYKTGEVWINEKYKLATSPCVPLVQGLAIASLVIGRSAPTSKRVVTTPQVITFQPLGV